MKRLNIDDILCLDMSLLCTVRLQPLHFADIVRFASMSDATLLNLRVRDVGF